MRVLLLVVLAAVLGSTAGQGCVDKKKTWKCQRKLAQKPHKCQKIRFKDRCQATCHACGSPAGQPVAPISSACSCTIYRNGANPRSTGACVKNEMHNGVMHVICSGRYNNVCPGDMKSCPYSPPSPPPPMIPPPAVPPAPPGLVVAYVVEAQLVVQGDVATVSAQEAAIRADLQARFPAATGIGLTFQSASVRITMRMVFDEGSSALSVARDSAEACEAALRATPSTTMNLAWFPNSSIVVEQVDLASISTEFKTIQPNGDPDPGSGDVGSGSGDTGSVEG